VTDAALVLAWLVLAHLAADFVLQTDAIAVGKFGDGQRAWTWLGVHVAVVAVVNLPLVPAYGLPGLGYAALTVLAHLAIDRVKIVLTKNTFPVSEPVVAEGGDPAAGPPLDRRWTPRPAALFMLDQLAHLGVLLVLWWLLLRGAPDAGFADAVGRLAGADPAVFHRLVLVLVVLLDLAIVNVRAASLFVGTLVRAPALAAPGSAGEQDRASPARVGAVIGVLERLIVCALVLAGAFNAIGLVIAAKTIARFRQLEDREFAEYYLLGTLASVGVAILTSLVAVAALG
jgi:Protein of unknown function (DUF3307)